MANKGAFINGDTGQTTSRELRFLHAGASFNTREEAKQYILDKVGDETINSTYAQPVVARYKDNGGEQIILGIGKGDNGFHFIDSAAIEHDIRAIIESIGVGSEGIDVVYSDEKLVSVKDEILKLNEIIQNGDETTAFDTINTVAAKIDEILSTISNDERVSNSIIESVGLNADGTLPEFESTEYIADGESLKHAIETLDESLAGVQSQVTSNKIASADGSIVVTADETGTDVAVNVDKTTVVVGNNGKVSTGLWIKKYDENDNIGPDLRAVYKLVDANGTPVSGSKDIEIPKDSSFVTAQLGTEDIYVDTNTGEIHDPGVEQGKKVDVLFLVYLNNENKYVGVQIPIGDFLQEAEFKDGLKVVNHEVYVRIDDTSEAFLSVSPDGVKLSGVQTAIDEAVESEKERAILEEEALDAAIKSEENRAKAAEKDIRQKVGLDEETGAYVPYTEGVYTSAATTVLDATSKLDDAVKDIQKQVIDNHVEGENAIVATPGDGKTVVSLKIGQEDKLLTNGTEGLHSTIDLVEVTGEELRALGNDVREAYKLTGVNSQIGAYIKIYNNSSALHSIAVGDMGDRFSAPLDGSDGKKTVYPDGIITGSTHQEAIRVIYKTDKLDDATGMAIYEMVLTDVDSFLQTDEFEDGLEVVHGEESDIVKVKIAEDSEEFLTVSITGVKLSGVQTAIDNAVEVEKERATAKENEIADNLASEITSARTEEARIEAKVDAEKTRAEAAEADLQSQITAEVERAIARENAIETDLQSEVTRATGEETRIESRLNGEIDRAIEQEDTIESNVGLDENGKHIQTEGNYTNAATTITGEIAALDTQVKNEQDEIDHVEDAAGFAADGTYVKYTGGAYISNATSVLDATSKLDDAIVDVQEQITANKVVGDNAIVVTTATTGTTVSLKLKGDNILTNNADGLYATLTIKQLSSGAAEALGENVREAYKLVGVDGETQLGDVIKVYKDSSLVDVSIGDMGDKFANPTTDDYHSKDTNIDAGITGKEALRFIYLLSDGTYEMALIDLSSYLRESEFEDGLEVSGHIVKVKIDPASEAFLSVSGNGVKLSGVQDAINDEANRATRQEDTIEGAVGLNTDGTHKRSGGTYTNNANTIADEIAALDAQAAANQTETDTIESAVGLDETGVHKPTSGKYTNSATTIAGEIAALDAEAFRHSGETDNIETAVGLDADGNYVRTTGDITRDADSVKAAIELLDRNAVSEQAEIDVVEDNVGLNADGTHKASGGHYTNDATTIVGEIAALDAEAYRHSGETNNIETAVGLDADGNYVHTTGQTTSAAESIKEAIELLDAKSSTDAGEVDNIEASVGLDENGGYVAPSGEYVSTSTTVKNAIELLDAQAVSNQTETDTIENGVGLNANGTHKPSGGHYTNNATTIAGEIAALDTQAKDEQDEIDRIESAAGFNENGTYKQTRTKYTSGTSSVYDAIEALDTQETSNQDETDRIESGVGLDASGNYVRPSGRYISGTSSVMEAIESLNAHASDSQNELDKAESSVGLNEDGSYKATRTRYTSGTSSVYSAIEALDTQEADNQNETDRIETGVGLNADGTYTSPSGKYVSGSTSVIDAISKLNTEFENVHTEIDETNDDLATVRSSVGLASDGSHVASSGRYTSGASTVEGEIVALDAQAVANQNETDAIENAVGLNADGTFKTINGNYTTDAGSTSDAIKAVDAQTKLNTDHIATNTSDILKNKVYSSSNAIEVEHTDTEGAGTKVGLTINGNDMVLTQDAGLLATIHLEKVTGVTTAGTAYTAIQLKGKEGRIIDEIDASDFVADGFLESVEVVTRGASTYIVFTWNTAAGSRVTEIPVTDIFVPYTASTGVRLVGHDFQGVVDPNSDKYLTVGLDGFKLDGIEEVVEEFEEAVRDINEKLVDIVSDNEALVITNEDQGFRKYRRLTITLGSTLDTTEAQLPEKNYLRIADDGLHTTIRPLTNEEIHGITNIDNIQ